jgi:hypothetical protein
MPLAPGSLGESSVQCAHCMYAAPAARCWRGLLAGN